MTITIKEFKSVSYSNQVNDPTINPSQLTDKGWIITGTPTNSQFAISQSLQGYTLRLTVDGSFNITGVKTGVTFRHKGASCFRHIGASSKRSN